MNHTLKKQQQKLVIGIEMRTSNDECQQTIPAHWAKFYKEQIRDKIPNKINGDTLVLYTDYEGDYTQPYNYTIGCEVSSLKQIPKGMVGKVVSQSTFAVFNTKGQFPQALGNTWQAIWKMALKRAYTTDLEVYSSDFNPQGNPEVKVYIAID